MVLSLALGLMKIKENHGYKSSCSSKLEGPYLTFCIVQNQGNRQVRETEPELKKTEG